MCVCVFLCNLSFILSRKHKFIGTLVEIGTQRKQHIFIHYITARRCQIHEVKINKFMLVFKGES